MASSDSYRVVVTEDALEQLKAIPNMEERKDILKRIYELEDDPTPLDVETINPPPETPLSVPIFRVRAGRYRIVYCIEEPDTVRVLLLGGEEEVLAELREDGVLEEGSSEENAS